MGCPRIIHGSQVPDFIRSHARPLRDERVAAFGQDLPDKDEERLKMHATPPKANASTTAFSSFFSGTCRAVRSPIVS